jgi:hypothetical protein
MRSFAASAFLLALIFVAATPAACADDRAPVGRGTGIYSSLKSFSLGYRTVHAENLVLKKDRVTLTFRDGVLYFPAPIEGKVRGAVFVGSGTFEAPAPPVPFERDNLRRMLKADSVSSDFKTAVLRFTDDSFDILGQGAKPDTAAVPPGATQLASDIDLRLLQEIGANLSARQTVAILNQESPGFFFVEVAGGHLGRFAYVLDQQSRIPVANFEINAGETGIIFTHDKPTDITDVWMAFHNEEAYQQGHAHYSDASDLISIPKYKMQVDLADPKKMLRVTSHMECVSRSDHVTAIPFVLNETISAYDNERRKKQLHVVKAHLSTGDPVEVLQEAWEGGFTVVLPAAVEKGQAFTLEVTVSGEFMKETQLTRTYFPISNESWYPRHGYLRRSVMDLQFLHRQKDVVASIGTVVHDEPVADNKEMRLTEFRLDEPVAIATFAAGEYEIHKDSAKIGDRTLPLEFYSMPGSRLAIKEDFILAELSNSVRYFSSIFGNYPYPVFRGVYHPFDYGIGYPSTVMIPAADSSNKGTFQFIAHETSHQWWGDEVLWRSYRDQWLSEGFAEYSGLLYTGTRDKATSEKELIERGRRELMNPPRTLTGIGKGHLADVGPLVMGHRLESSETHGAYEALIYSKGALVLRMLHFLFTDPQTGNGQPFFDMMSEFVRQHAGGVASTDEFFAVANARIGQTALAQKFGYKDLNWFYRQWVTQAYLPSYRLAYELKDQPDGSAILEGTLYQDNVPDSEKWFMPLPLALTLAKGSTAMVAIGVQGKETPIRVKLPSHPQKVELDPYLWVLSEKTSVSKR